MGQPDCSEPIALHDMQRLASTQIDPAAAGWLRQWACGVMAGQPPRAHLAVMTGSYLQLILCGVKTIESRFTRNRIAPFGQLSTGDVIFFKPSSAPIVAAGRASDVLHIDLREVTLSEVQHRFGHAIAPVEATFWTDRSRARYATLVHLTDVTELPTPVLVDKRDRRGWVVLGVPGRSGASALLDEDSQPPNISIHEVAAVQNNVSELAQRTKVCLSGMR